MGGTAAASRIPWWTWVIAVNVVLIVLILFGDYWPRDEVSRAVLSWLAIQQEMNLAAWWSGAQLFLGTLLMYERASLGVLDERPAWAVLAFVSAGLSFDEIGSIHERLGDRTWRPLFLLAVPLVALLVWALLRLVRKPERRWEVILIVVAYVLFTGVAGLEYLESVVRWQAPEGMGQELEESTELAGFLTLLFAAGRHRRPARADLRGMIPDPGSLRGLRSLLVLGLVPHAVVALVVHPQLTDLDRRGAPIVWYQFAVYAVLACHALVTRDRAPDADRRAWGWLAGLFLVCSIGAVFPLSKLLPYIELVSPRWVYDGSYATYIFLVPPVLLLARRVLGGHDRTLRRVVAAMAVLLLVRLPGPIWWLDAMLPAVVACLWALAFLAPASAPEGSGAPVRVGPSLRVPHR